MPGLGIDSKPCTWWPNTNTERERTHVGQHTHSDGARGAGARHADVDDHVRCRRVGRRAGARHQMDLARAHVHSLPAAESAVPARQPTM